MSYLFAFSYCSWGSNGKKTGVVCHPSSSGPRFVRTFHCDPSTLGGRACMAWLIASLSYVSLFTTTRLWSMKGPNLIWKDKLDITFLVLVTAIIGQPVFWTIKRILIWFWTEVEYTLRASLMTQTVKNIPAMRETWVGKIPWRRACNPLQYSCLENPHGQRSLAG